MCITAHPDDESGGFGGALLLSHAHGVETTVICLTEGRAASNRGAATTDDELAEERKREFAESCSILGVTHHQVWNYADGALLHERGYDVTRRLVRCIRSMRPHVVLTFGGDGGPNLHRDHAMAGVFATVSFHWAGRSFFEPDELENGLGLWAPQKLYYASTEFTVTKFKDEAAVAPKTPASLVLELGELKEIKRRAIEVHRTQLVMDRAGEMYKQYGHQESYLLAAARKPELLGRETSLFEGIDPE
jgi:LmbE family N-acetylglucosaminyl deacetylase